MLGVLIFRANNKNLLFEINESRFDELQRQDCYICGKVSSDIHTNGIDRIDNSLGYIESNIATCCGECNIMKRHYSLTEMMDKCILIVCYENTKNTECELVEAEANVQLKIDYSCQSNEKIITKNHEKLTKEHNKYKNARKANTFKNSEEILKK